MVCYPQNDGTIVLKMVVFAVVVDCFSMNYNRRQINNYKTKIKQLKNTQHTVFSFFYGHAECEKCASNFSE